MAELTRERIDAEHFVARYARGALSEAETELFEEYCLLHPEVVRDVSADRALRHALKSIDSRDAARGRSSRWWQLAIAASLAFVAVAIGWQFRPADLPTIALYDLSQDLPAELRAHVAGPYSVIRVRGGNVQTLRIPVDAEGVRLDIELPGSLAATGARLRLEELDANSWVSRGQIVVKSVAAEGTSTIPVVVDLRVIRSPRVRLTVQRAGGAADAFELQLEHVR